jgi:hypothetical protein
MEKQNTTVSAPRFRTVKYFFILQIKNFIFFI